MIAELVATAPEITAEAQPRHCFAPPLVEDQLAFYDAVAQNPSTVGILAAGLLADIARDPVS